MATPVSETIATPVIDSTKKDGDVTSSILAEPAGDAASSSAPTGDNILSVKAEEPVESSDATATPEGKDTAVLQNGIHSKNEEELFAAEENIVEERLGLVSDLEKPDDKAVEPHVAAITSDKSDLNGVIATVDSPIIEDKREEQPAAASEAISEAVNEHERAEDVTAPSTANAEVSESLAVQAAISSDKSDLSGVSATVDSPNIKSKQEEQPATASEEEKTEDVPVPTTIKAEVPESLAVQAAITSDKSDLSGVSATVDSPIIESKQEEKPATASEEEKTENVPVPTTIKAEEPKLSKGPESDSEADNEKAIEEARPEAGADDDKKPTSEKPESQLEPQTNAPPAEIAAVAEVASEQQKDTSTAADILEPAEEILQQDAIVETALPTDSPGEPIESKSEQPIASTGSGDDPKDHTPASTDIVESTPVSIPAREPEEEPTGSEPTVSTVKEGSVVTPADTVESQPSETVNEEGSKPDDVVKPIGVVTPAEIVESQPSETVKESESLEVNSETAPPIEVTEPTNQKEPASEPTAIAALPSIEQAPAELKPTDTTEAQQAGDILAEEKAVPAPVSEVNASKDDTTPSTLANEHVSNPGLEETESTPAPIDALTLEASQEIAAAEPITESVSGETQADVETTPAGLSTGETEPETVHELTQSVPEVAPSSTQSEIVSEPTQPAQDPVQELTPPVTESEPVPDTEDIAEKSVTPSTATFLPLNEEPLNEEPVTEEPVTEEPVTEEPVTEKEQSPEESSVLEQKDEVAPSKELEASVEPQLDGEEAQNQEQKDEAESQPSEIVAIQEETKDELAINGESEVPIATELKSEEISVVDDLKEDQNKGDNQPEIVQPEIVQPEIVQPEIVQPEIVQPEIVQPEIVQPGNLQSDPEIPIAIDSKSEKIPVGDELKENQYEVASQPSENAVNHEETKDELANSEPGLEDKPDQDPIAIHAPEGEAQKETAGIKQDEDPATLEEEIPRTDEDILTPDTVAANAVVLDKELQEEIPGTADDILTPDVVAAGAVAAGVAAGAAVVAQNIQKDEEPARAQAPVEQSSKPESKDTLAVPLESQPLASAESSGTAKQAPIHEPAADPAPAPVEESDNKSSKPETKIDTLAVPLESQTLASAESSGTAKQAPIHEPAADPAPAPVEESDNKSSKPETKIDTLAVPLESQTLASAESSGTAKQAPIHEPAADPAPAPVEESDNKSSKPETKIDALAIPSQPPTLASAESSGTAKQPTPEPEADPALAALAGDGEALLRKLELPSTEQLPTAADKNANLESETSTTTKSGPSAEPQPASTTEGTADKTAENKGEDSRAPSQNRDLFLMIVVAAPFLAFLWQAIYTPGSA